MKNRTENGDVSAGMRGDPRSFKNISKNQKTFEKGIDKCEWIWYYY